MRNCEDLQGVIAVCDEMVERFDDTSDQALLARMARVLIHGARARCEFGEFSSAVLAYGEVISRFGSSKSPDFQFPVALALVKKASAICKCNWVSWVRERYWRMMR